MFISCSRSWRRWLWWVFYSLLCLVLHNEWLCYLTSTWSWPNLEGLPACASSSTSYRILLVADPQILGENTESAIARWDADRYLSKTFSLAVEEYRPSLIVFLGDLMDEGSVASNSQFQRYYDRFHQIFDLNRFKNKSLYIPGDNDIGGEDKDFITREKVLRFRNHFNQPETFQTSNIVIFKVNHMLRSYSAINVTDTKVVRIAISHFPMLDMTSRFMQRALVETQAQVILSAHEHKSMHFVGSRKTGERLLAEESQVNEFSPLLPYTWLYQLDSQLSNELTVPTCSYRMGTESMAYALLNIDRRGESVCYSLLWLPKRLSILKLYLYYFGFVFGSTLLFIILSKFFCRLRSSRLLPL